MKNKKQKVKKNERKKKDFTALNARSPTKGKSRKRLGRGSTTKNKANTYKSRARLTDNE